MSTAMAPVPLAPVFVLPPAPVRVSEPEMKAVHEIACFITKLQETVRRPALIGPQGERIDLPEPVYHLLCQAVEHLRRGESVSIFSADEDLTTQQAADLLNVSRPYLVRLLEAGKIPFHKVGAHRRVRLDDVMAFRAVRDRQRQKSLRQLTQLSEEHGLYDPTDKTAA